MPIEEKKMFNFLEGELKQWKNCQFNKLELLKYICIVRNGCFSQSQKLKFGHLLSEHILKNEKNFSLIYEMACQDYPVHDVWNIKFNFKNCSIDVLVKFGIILHKALSQSP
jgi:hypothetical protein